MSREKGTKRKTQNERKNLFGRFINRLRSTELCVPKLGQKRALYCGPGINRLDEIKCDKDKSRVFAAERAKTFHIRVGMRVKRKVLDMVWALNCTKNHSSEDTNEHGLEVSNRSEIDSPPATPTSPTLQHGIVTYVMDEGTLYFVGRNDSKNVENVFKRLKEKNDCRVGDICFAKHPVADKFCRDRIIHIDPTKPLHKTNYVVRGGRCLFKFLISIALWILVLLLLCYYSRSLAYTTLIELIFSDNSDNPTKG